MDPMRIALLSDIHGNLPALEAVLDDVNDVDMVVCLGDVVGYGPWPAACLERIREIAALTVQGNHDRAIETPQQYAHNDMARAGLEHAQSELTDDQIEWLLAIPQQTTVADDRYRLVHSHPDPEKLGSYVMPGDFPQMRPYLDDFEGIALGHTHVQHQAYIDGRIIFNPGSVGQPRDKNPDAAYAVLNAHSQAVEFRRVGYDIERVISRIEDEGLPTQTGERLLQGR